MRIHIVSCLSDRTRTPGQNASHILGRLGLESVPEFCSLGPSPSHAGDLGIPFTKMLVCTSPGKTQSCKLCWSWRSTFYLRHTQRCSSTWPLPFGTQFSGTVLQEKGKSSATKQSQAPQALRSHPRSMRRRLFETGIIFLFSLCSA